MCSFVCELSCGRTWIDVLTRSTTVVRQTVNLLVEGSNPSESVPLLCNGSTGDFDSSSLGSNPSEGTPS